MFQHNHCGKAAILITKITFLSLLSSCLALLTDRNVDQFNYGDSSTHRTKNTIVYDWGPEDWENVQCPNMDTCVSYITKIIKRKN